MTLYFGWLVVLLVVMYCDECAYVYICVCALVRAYSVLAGTRYIFETRARSRHSGMVGKQVYGLKKKKNNKKSINYKH